jgi:hypothetical protein
MDVEKATPMMSPTTNSACKKRRLPGVSSAFPCRNFVRLVHSLSVVMLLIGVPCFRSSAQTPTTTSLAVSSAAISVGSSETLTASVLTGGTPVTNGSVEFRDNLASPGGTLLGNSVLNGSGSAALTITTLSVGLHKISAIYAGSNSHGLSPSVSIPYQTVTVTGPSLLPTMTAMGAAGAAGYYSLTATVSALTSVQPTGSVSFLDASNGDASLATQTLDPTTLSYGIATLSTPSAVLGETSVAVGDFNEDGHLDLAVANSYSGTLSILLGDGAGNFTPATTPTVVVGHNPYSIAVGDFNGDGHLDMAVANFTDNTLTVLLGDGTGNFSPAATPTVTVGLSPYSIEVGDFNGDGHLDLAVANSADNNVSILLNDGSGNFSAAPSSPITVGVSPFSVAVGDFVGNGKLDLAVANRCGNDPQCNSPGTVTVLKGDGTGNFTTGTTVTVESSPYSVAVGDFNGDGLLDLAVANECGNDPFCSSPGTVSVLLGDGAGNFAPAATPTVAVGVNPWSVAVGDFNGDGLLDLAVANFTDSTTSVLLGDGAGNFSPAATSPVAVGVNPESVAVGDFNGDGNPDLAVANFTDGTVSVLYALWTESGTAPVIFTSSASHNVMAGYAGDAVYAPSQSPPPPLSLPGLLPTGLVWSPVSAILYGTTLNGMLNATTHYNGLPVASTCAYTATPSGGSTFTVYSSTVLAVGSYTLGVTCTGYYPTGTGSAPLTVYASGYVLTTSVNNSLAGTVTPTSGETYAPTVQVAISATPNHGYSFLGWEANSDINSTGSANTYVTMNSAETVTADFELIPSFVVNTNQDDSSTPNASNCPANPSGTGSGPCTLRDALLASTANGGNITFDPTVFAPGNTTAENTITLGTDGTLTIPTITTITGATTGSGAALTNLVAVSGNSGNSVFTLSGGTAAINNLTIENGSPAGNGGGISNSGTLTVSASTFFGNSASHGGAIGNSGSLTVSGSTFYGNSATYGGAISVLSGSVTVSDSTFYNNLGSSGAGAIDDTEGGSFTVTGSTIYGNTSTDDSGAIAVSRSSFSMSDSIATSNTGGDCIGNSCPANGTGGNVVSAAANLAPLGKYGGSTETMIPLPGSVAICAIVPSGSGTDQRGMAWPVTYSGTSCQDSGAVQTDYALNFVQQPSTIMIFADMSPAPTVELKENGNPFAPAVTIPLVLKDSSGNNITAPDLSGGSVATSSGVATYSSLAVAAAGTGDTLTASLALHSATTITSIGNSFNVTLKPTTTVASNASATYSASAQNVTLSATVTSSLGTVNAGTVTFTVFNGGTPVGVAVTSGTLTSGAASITYSLPGGTAVGTYTVQAVYNAGGGFATSSDSTHSLTVGMATATVTLGNLSQTYTGSPLAATATTTPSGLAVNFTYNGSSSAPTAVGSYAVVGTISDSNYQGSSSGTLAIGKAALSVTANPASSVYGVAFPAFTGTLTGVVTGDGIAATYSTTATPTSAAGGTYSITATLVDPNSKLANYTVTNTPATLTITKAALTVTVNPASSVYGVAFPAFTGTLTGVVTGDGIAATYSTTATPTSAAGGAYSITATLVDPNSKLANYTVTNTPATLTITKAATTITWATPAAITSGTALSATQLNASSSVAGTFVYTPAMGAVLGTGPQTLSVTMNPTDSTDYNTATATVQLTVNTNAQTISFAALSPVTYGTAPITLSATGGASGNPIVFSIGSGPGTITGNTLTINGAGMVVVAANQAGNATYTAATQVTQSIVVNPALSAIAMASNTGTVLAQNAVMLTATVSSPAGVPTGTVSFLDGTSPLGLGTLSNGVATLTTSSLAVGTHSITAVYSGETNFAAASSPALTQYVMDISLGTTSGDSSQTITAGGSAAYPLAIAPNSGTSFPVAVTLTVSGLPSTATASITPSAWALSSNNPWTWTLPANTPLTGNSQLTIQIPQTLAQKGAAGSNLALRLAPLSLALLLLPFAGGMRRAGKRLRRAAFALLLAIAGMAAMAGLSGCGSPSIFFTQQPETYPVTVTVNAGTLTHSVPLTLVVE